MTREMEVLNKSESISPVDQGKSGQILVALVIIVAVGIFFRFYHLKDIYYELDDVYWIAGHKTPVTDIVRTKSFSQVDVRLTVKKEFIHNLLDSPLYGFYVAHISTSPIMAYLFHPLFIYESDTFYEKVLKSRGYVSVLCSIGLILFVYLLYIMNGRKLAPSLIIPKYSNSCW